MNQGSGLLQYNAIYYNINCLVYFFRARFVILSASVLKPEHFQFLFYLLVFFFFSIVAFTAVLFILPYRVAKIYATTTLKRSCNVNAKPYFANTVMDGKISLYNCQRCFRKRHIHQKLPHNVQCFIEPFFLFGIYG